MKKYLFFLLAIFVLFSCKEEINISKEPPLPKEVDSLFKVAYNNSLTLDTREAAINNIDNYLNQRKNDSTRRRNYLKVANRYYSINNHEGRYKSAKMANELAVRARDTFIIARSNMYLGKYYLHLNKMDSAFYYSYKASTYFSSAKDNETQKSALSTLSLILKSVKNYTESEKYVIKALEIVESDNNYFSKYGVYNTLGKLFAETKKYDLAFDYHNRALNATDHFNEKQKTYQLRLKSQSLLNIAILKMDQGLYREAETYFEKADNLGILPKQNPINYAYFLENWAYNRHRLKKNKVMSLFNKALRVHDSVNSPSRSTGELLLAKYYKDIKNNDSAFYFAQKAYYTTRKNGQLGEELKALHLMAQTDSLKKTRQWYETYLTLQDSITLNERNQQEKFALIEFNTENLIKEKQSAEKERDKADKGFWVATLLSVLILVISVMVYINRARKLKNKELLLAQKELEANESLYNLMLEEQFKIEQGKHFEKKRMSQELHDGILGKLSGIRLNLFVLNKRKDAETVEKCLPYIKSLQDVEKEIRAISHNLSEDLFSDQVNFTKMISSLFENITGDSKLKLNLYFDELIDWKVVSNSTKIEVYRIFQEGLHNIKKHAKANTVIVKMEQTETHLVIELIDNGVGFSNTIKSKGIGLKNMKERASKINAELKIVSQPNLGTTLSISIPKTF
ncbi:tetratricopeptide repeat-containing sensor histidine kinase [Winogradskyella costae]|uniref:tetratricopeptide repeat-containing sensor histidine kinase n=1 Tax=Winogradskyella costae TaxID=2697008 RepID=UPI0015C9EB48|nr:sensor histidine kinase [Winogradskyella costae]